MQEAIFDPVSLVIVELWHLEFAKMGQKCLYFEPGQQLRSKNFISQPNPMMLPLIKIVSERRFQ